MYLFYSFTAFICDSERLIVGVCELVQYRKDPVGSSDEAETDLHKQSEKNANNSTTLAPSGEQTS